LIASSKCNISEARFKKGLKRAQEHQDLYWFTLSQHPVSLPISK